MSMARSSGETDLCLPACMCIRPNRSTTEEPWPLLWAWGFTRKGPADPVDLVGWHHLAVHRGRVPCKETSGRYLLPMSVSGFLHYQQSQLFVKQYSRSYLLLTLIFMQRHRSSQAASSIDKLLMSSVPYLFETAQCRLQDKWERGSMWWSACKALCYKYLWKSAYSFWINIGKYRHKIPYIKNCRELWSYPDTSSKVELSQSLYHLRVRGFW